MTTEEPRSFPQAHLATVLEQMPAAVMMVEAGSERLTLNNAQADAIMHGPLALGRRLDELDLKMFSRAGRPYATADWPITRALRQGEVIADEEVDIIRRDATSGTLRISAAPIHEAGRIVAAVATFYDITHQKRAEQERQALFLREQTAQATIHSILESITDYFFAFDTTWHYTYLNSKSEELLQIPRSELIGKNVWELLPDLVGTHVYHEWHRAMLEQATVEFETFFPPRSIWFEVHAYPSPEGLSVYLRDISARKREETIREILASVNAVLSTSLDYATTLQHIVQLAVPQFADWCLIHVLDDDGVIQQLAAFHPDPQMLALLAELHQHYPADPQAQLGYPFVLRTGQSELITGISPAMLAASGRSIEHVRLLEQFDLRSHICVPLLARNRMLGALTFATGSSARQFQPADLALAQEFAQRAALAIDNALLYQEAQVAIKTRDAFLSIASHELKTPLTSLLGFAHMLRQTVEGDNQGNPRLRRAVQVIVRQARRLTMMIDGMLDSSRLQLGQFNLTRQPVYIVALAAQVVQEVELTLPQRTIEFSYPDEVLIIDGDELRLEQVLQNLLGNAVKYSPDGGYIRLNIARQAQHIVITVQDQGIGIPSAALPKLFQPFYRADNVGQQSSGFGIGLYVVDQIVHRHGGTIDVTSTEGAGSMFRVYLPLERMKDEG